MPIKDLGKSRSVRSYALSFKEVRRASTRLEGPQRINNSTTCDRMATSSATDLSKNRIFDNLPATSSRSAISSVLHRIDTIVQ